MRDTFYVGYEPTLKLWDVSSITHSFDSDMWVFRVAARSEYDALQQGLKQYQALMAPVSADQERLFVHVRNQVGRLSRMLHEAMIIEIPPSLVGAANAAAETGFFRLAGSDELILNTSDVGWKAIQARSPREPERQQRPPDELAFG